MEEEKAHEAAELLKKKTYIDKRLEQLEKSGVRIEVTGWTGYEQRDIGIDVEETGKIAAKILRAELLNERNKINERIQNL